VGNTNDSDLWIKDLRSGTFSRLTSTAGPENQPVWSPDSQRLAFVGAGGGPRAASTAQSLWFTRVGSGDVVPVPQAEGYGLLEQWTPDGKYLLARGQSRVGLIPAPGDRAIAAVDAKDTPRVLLRYPYPVDHLRASPDGRWVSYTSQQSGSPEVMVAAFPSFTERRQISLAGGTQPQWRVDGRELFFHAPDQRMMAVDVTPGDALQTGPVRELFRTNPAVLHTQAYMYAATPDGQRFLLREPAASGSATAVEPIFVVANWTALVGR
jgi:Tol biopolymer transport system component